MYDLLYGGEFVACSDDPQTLFSLKVSMIAKKEIRYPSLLEIFHHGCAPWIFDRCLSYKEAVKLRADSFVGFV